MQREALQVWTWIIVALLLCCLGLTVFVIAHQGDSPDTTRRVLCIGILGNEENTSRDDPRLLKYCADVGVYP